MCWAASDAPAPGESYTQDSVSPGQACGMLYRKESWTRSNEPGEVK